jgi:hypothetical protein
MGRNPVLRHKYSFFPLVKNQCFDFAANHGPSQFLAISIKNNGLSLGVGSGPAFLGSRGLRCLPSSRGHTPSLTEPGRGDRQGAEQTMASAAEQGAPRVFGRATPGSLAPPKNAPQNLRRFLNHRCRGAPAKPRTGSPHLPTQRIVGCRARTWTEVSCGARRPSSGSGGLGVGSSGRARGGGGRAQPSLPLPMPGTSTRPSRLTVAAGRESGGAQPAASKGKPLSLFCGREAVSLWGGERLR